MASLLDFANDQPTPPPNPAVLDVVEGLRQGWQNNVNAYNAQGGNGLLQYGNFSPGGNAGIVADNPGLSGYFDVQPGGNIVPRVSPPQQVAADNNQGLGQLAGSFFPSGNLLDGGIGYNVHNDSPDQPGNDRGGFFTLQDLYSQRQGPSGIGVQGVPSIGTADMSQMSTNNWRLLGRGPGWIMRNGRMIYTQAPEVKFGGWVGAPMGFGVTAEHGMGALNRSVLGTGAWMGMPNTWTGASGWPGQDRPYTPDRWNAGPG